MDDGDRPVIKQHLTYFKILFMSVHLTFIIDLKDPDGHLWVKNAVVLNV